MDLLSFFKGGKYFDKNITPKCDYCQFGRRAKDGSKVLCEKKGLVEREYSCGKFIYSPLKRIPVKQLSFVGSLADEDIYIESAGDRAEKEEEERSVSPKTSPKKAQPAKAPENKPEPKAEETAPVEEEAPRTEEAPAEESELSEADAAIQEALNSLNGNS